MLSRVARGILATACQQSQRCEQLIGPALTAAQQNALITETAGSDCQRLGVAFNDAADANRASSHEQASTSFRCTATREQHQAPPSLPASLGSCMQLQQLRAYGYLPPKPRFRLPEHISQLVFKKIREKKAAAAAAAASPPTLEPRPMKEDSLRVGCIAIKAGMTQEWDEHGVRVPLTVLWIDECQVVGLKTKAIHGYNAVMLGAGHKRQKCLSPSQAGFFLKAGLPFKRLVAEWQVSEDALLPVGTHIGGAHFVPGQRVDVTGWTKWKGFQGVMKRWGFKGLPASHGVSLAHRSPGSIGGRQDPGKVWKGKKLPGHMGNERRTVHRCLVYKVDAARNLVYIRGQVPGPVGRSVYLRDSRLVSPAHRASWGLPFPTHIPSPEQVAAAPAPGDLTALPDPAAVAVYRNPKDPYLMYREETDYFPIVWKKGE